MEHISFWAMLMILIYWTKYKYHNKQAASKEVGLEVNAGRT
jgi:hypothetical protein